MDMNKLGKDVKKDPYGNSKSTVVLELFLFLSAAEFFCAWLWYVNFYQGAWWKNPVSWAGIVILAGLFIFALLFCFFGYVVHSRSQKVATTLSKFVDGKFFTLTFSFLILFFMTVLVIILLPVLSFLHTINRHSGLLYLSAFLVSQMLFALIYLKLKSQNVRLVNFIQKGKNMIGKPTGKFISRSFILLETYAARKEFFATTLVFAALIYSFFAPTLIQGKLPLSTSYLYQFYPWAFYDNQFENDMIFNNVLSDDYDSGIPAMKFIFTEIQNGRFPFWIPYVNSGVPSGILMFSSIFSLHGLSILIGGVKWGTILYMCLKIYTAGIFMYYYLRLRQFARTSAFLGSLVLMFSSHLIVNGMAEVPDAVIYAPAILYFAERFIHERKHWQFFCLTISVAAVLLSGFPSVIMYTLLLVALYLAYRNLIELKEQIFFLRIKNIATLYLAFFIGALLLAFTLLPTYEFFKAINIGYRIGRGPTVFDWVMIGRLINPNICGNPVQGNWFCSSNYNETALYVGLLPLLLVPFGLTNKNHILTTSFFFASALLILLIVFGVGSLNQIIGSLPLFSVNPNTRMIALLPLCFAFVSASGFDNVAKTAGNRGYWSLIYFALLAIFSFWAFDNIPLTQITNEIKVEYYLRQSFFTMFFLLIYLIVIMAMLTFKHKNFILSASVLLLFFNFAERSLLMGGYQGASYSGTFYPETPAISFLESKMPRYERIVTIGHHFIPSFPLYYSINSLSGHAFADVAFKNNLELINPDIYLNDTTQPLFMSDAIDLLSSLLDIYRVRYIVTSPLDPPIWITSIANQKEYNQVYTFNDINSFGQSITVKRSGYLDSLEIRLSARSMERIPVNLNMSSHGEVLVNFDGYLIRQDDNHYSINLPRIQVLQEDVISILLTPSRNALPADSKLLIVDFDAYKGGSLIIDGKESKGDMAFNLFRYDSGVAYKYKQVHGEDLNIYENTTLSDEIPVVTRLKYSNPDSCASVLGKIDPLTEAVVEDQDLDLAEATLNSHAWIREYTGNRVVIDADIQQSSMVVLSDTYDKGWQAKIDGERAKIYRVNCAMRGVVVPPGKHVIEMSYSPPFFKVGLAISLLTFLCLSFAGVIIKLSARKAFGKDDVMCIIVGCAQLKRIET